MQPEHFFFMFDNGLKKYALTLPVSLLEGTCFCSKKHLDMQHTPSLHPECSVMQNPVLLHPALLRCLEIYVPNLQSSKFHQTCIYNYKKQLG